jgi:uncharacterized membrane protein YesL
MRFLNSKFYSFLETTTNFFLLNVLWILMCLPIVTIFPATAAMFGVTRNWVFKHHTSVFRSFSRLFKANFKQSFIIGLFWIVITGIICFDLWIIDNVNETIKFPIMVAVLILGSLVGFLLLNLFPLMVHFNFSIVGLIKNAFLCSFIFFPSTLLIVGIIVATGLTVVFLPITALFAFSVASYWIYVVCHNNFHEVEKLIQA